MFNMFKKIREIRKLTNDLEELIQFSLKIKKQLIDYFLLNEKLNIKKSGYAIYPKLNYDELLKLKNDNFISITKGLINNIEREISSFITRIDELDSNNRYMLGLVERIMLLNNENTLLLVGLMSLSKK